ncbi:MAG: hypothetical protein ACQKBT_03755 [Puniceicoccales bacterium]
MKPYPIFLTLLVILLGYSLGDQFTRQTEWAVQLEAETGGILKWYIDTGDGFSEREGNYGPVPHGESTVVKIDLPTGSPRKIRLDPVNTESRIAIKKVEWREPWPGGRGELDLEEATWENVVSAGRDSSGMWILLPIPGSDDVYGVWQEMPTHSLLWWRLVRLGGGLLLGLVAFVGGTLWNRKILREIGSEEPSPPFAI